MTRIAVGGFQHETNTFAPVPADFAAFERPGGWPGLSRGEALFGAVDGINIPIRGAVETLRAAGATMIPLAWCQATPSAHVTEDAFERISAMLLDGLAEALADGPLAGIYLDLHGAMVCRHLEDGEGELLARIRDLVGPDVPIAVSLDLHANVTEAMVAKADYLDIYRTYPHVDMAETGARTARQLLRLTESGGRPAKAFRRPAFLVPLTFGCTDIDPAQSLYGQVLPDLLAGGHLAGLALAMGFPLADIREVGPSLIAYGDDARAADRAADRLLDALTAAEPAFAGRIWQRDAAVAEAKRLLFQPGRGPVVLADTQDNPGGGGTGDTTGLLRALLAAGAGSWPGGTAIGVFNDPETADAAHRHPIGSSVAFALGGKLCPGDTPVTAKFEIRALGDGRFTGTGPMWGGARFDMGAYACLRLDGIDIVVASRPEQAGDRAMFRHVGIDTESRGLVALKSSVHFRADFAPIARAVLTVAAPGPVFADPGALTFEKARRGLRLRPAG
jgi:microcystin degradation protein MlrC